MRGTTPELIRRARSMRHHMTEAEARLWNALRLKRLNGLRFRSQHAVGSFILDFYCPRLKLAIELDGPDHAYRVAYDELRTEHLTAFGAHVLRFRDDEVLADIGGCLNRILEAARDDAVPPGFGG